MGQQMEGGEVCENITDFIILFHHGSSIWKKNHNNPVDILEYCDSEEKLMT